MIKLKDIIKEIIQEDSINQKIDKLPQGKIFDDAKNIKDIFKKSSYSWSEVVELFEKNKHKSKPEILDIKDIHITQPNIQANKVKNMLDKVNNLSPINVVEFENGEKVIYDGHHRLVANWALNNNKIKVNLVKINNLREDLKNLITGLIYEIKGKEILTEKDDRCTRIAKSKYDTWPSAYASGAVVRCRRGDIWKDLK
jgi:hypothetical protein